MGVVRARSGHLPLLDRGNNRHPRREHSGAGGDPELSLGEVELQHRAGRTKRRFEGPLMLAGHAIDVMLLETDLAAAKRFYIEQLGLETVLETDDFVTFKCGGDS